MFQATRRRLALWYISITALLLLVFASGVYLYVRGTLVDRIDDTLNHVVEVVERSLVIERPVGSSLPLQVNAEASFRSSPASAEDDRIDLEWFGPTGKLIWSTVDPPWPTPLSAARQIATVNVRQDSYGEPVLVRQLTVPVQVDRQLLGYLRVSHPWFEVTRPSRQFVIDLLFGSLLMLIGVGATGWLLSGLAMRPVRESYQQLRQFTADASHELRNPVALIQTNVQAVLADPNTSQQEQQHLQVIERLTRRLGLLVDDLLFLARQESGMLRPTWSDVNLDELLLEVIEEQDARAQEKQIDLRLDVPEELTAELRCRGDRQQLVRLFTNLISNALQYTPAGGRVTVQLAHRSKPEEISVSIEDTGIGIPAQALPHLFERFYRTDTARSRQEGGSGLGLAIAQSIVELHQGQLQVSSEVGQGSCFRVVLPALNSAPLGSRA
jgi:OmpR-family two-component system manganese-sensing sensor histidine kinase